MIGETSTAENRATRQWLLNFTICLFGLVIVLVYEATMTARLVQEERFSEYRELDDLVNCIIPTSDICLPRGDVLEELWRTMFLERECRRTDPWPRLISSYDKLTDLVANGTCKFAISYASNVLAAQHERYCGSLVSVGKPFGTRGLAMIAPHNWAYFDEMRKATLRINEAGLVPSSVSKYYENVGKCELSAPPHLTFQQLRVFFLLALSAWSVMLLFMAFDQQKERPPTTSSSEEKEERIRRSAG